MVSGHTGQCGSHTEVSRTGYGVSKACLPLWKNDHCLSPALGHGRALWPVLYQQRLQFNYAISASFVHHQCCRPSPSSLPRLQIWHLTLCQLPSIITPQLPRTLLIVPASLSNQCECMEQSNGIVPLRHYWWHLHPVSLTPGRSWGYRIPLCQPLWLLGIDISRVLFIAWESSR